TRCINPTCPAQVLEHLRHFVAALDIEGFGYATLQQLIDRKLVKDPADLYHLTRAQLLTLEGFAEKSAQNLLDRIEASKPTTFVLTGTLSALNRGEAEERIKALGGAIGSNVSKKTDYLVVGADPGSKLEKAQRLKVPILDEAAFLELIGGPSDNAR